ncbi:SCO4402 family protein [Streptomyces sp. enrichment culture]|uniref:SCO4402 family protein n=1 Tax=Streptomyces sp. enrichment culture TaxID=1795815 RepID=UPI003F57443E
MTVQGTENTSRRGRRSSTMGGMPLNDMPWWRWRSHVRSALHMLSDPDFQRDVWLAGVDGYGDVTDAVYRLVEDTWLDHWSAEKYVGTIFRDSQEAALVDTAVLRVLRIMHEVGPDAPVPTYLAHPSWPDAVRAARDAHVRLSTADGDDPDAAPRSLEALRVLTRSA